MPTPRATVPVRRISPQTALVLALAVLAISSSAVLVQWADASPVALAFWRTLGGAVILAPSARRSAIKPSRAQWQAIAVAGVALSIHFASWLASLELTSVAASVTLVSTTPILIAAYLALTGRNPGRATWLAVGLAVVGVVVITGGDVGASTTGSDGDDTALLGDGLALVGAATMACYLLIGDRLRSTHPVAGGARPDRLGESSPLSTSGYASRTYGVAAAATFVIAVIADIDLFGFDTKTWLAIGAMIAGPQLAGHTALNYLVGRLGSVTISLALLVEPLGASVLVWLFFGDVPPMAAVLGAPLVMGAIAIQVTNRALTNDFREP
ncbi:MAG: DMT family transporter [Acidimicrobiales bacterium]